MPENISIVSVKVDHNTGDVFLLCECTEQATPCMYEYPEHAEIVTVRLWKEDLFPSNKAVEEAEK